MTAFAEETSPGGVGLQVVPTINGDLAMLNVLDDAPAAETVFSRGSDLSG